MKRRLNMRRTDSARAHAHRSLGEEMVLPYRPETTEMTKKMKQEGNLHDHCTSANNQVRFCRRYPRLQQASEHSTRTCEDTCTHAQITTVATTEERTEGERVKKRVLEAVEEDEEDGKRVAEEEMKAALKQKKKSTPVLDVGSQGIRRITQGKELVPNCKKKKGLSRQARIL